MTKKCPEINPVRNSIAKLFRNRRDHLISSIADIAVDGLISMFGDCRSTNKCIGYFEFNLFVDKGLSALWSDCMRATMINKNDEVEK